MEHLCWDCKTKIETNISGKGIYCPNCGRYIKNEYYKKCAICNEDFMSQNKKHDYCPKCIGEHNKEYSIMECNIFDEEKQRLLDLLSEQKLLRANKCDLFRKTKQTLELAEKRKHYFIWCELANYYLHTMEPKIFEAWITL